MAFKKTDKPKIDPQYATLMEVLQSADDDEKVYVKANTYKGRLIWQAFGGEDGDDEENSEFYEILSAQVWEPFKDSPPFVLQRIVINLNNPKAAKLLVEE